MGPVPPSRPLATPTRCPSDAIKFPYKPDCTPSSFPPTPPNTPLPLSLPNLARAPRTPFLAPSLTPRHRVLVVLVEKVEILVVPALVTRLVRPVLNRRQLLDLVLLVVIFPFRAQLLVQIPDEPP